MLIIIAIIAVILIIIVFIFAPKSKDIPAKYEKAKKYLQDEENSKALAMTDEFIIFPISGKYSYDSAIQLIKSLHLLEEICKSQNYSKKDLIDPIIAALSLIQDDGGKLDMDEIDELEQWINKISGSVEDQVSAVMDDVKSGKIKVIEKTFEPDFDNEITDPDQIEIINKVGKFFLVSNKQKGIDFINKILPSEMSAFKASLLDSKAGLFFMSGKVDQALPLYKEILESYPKSNRVKTALVEALFELGIYQEAIDQARIVIKESIDHDNLKTCEKIIKKASKKL